MIDIDPNNPPPGHTVKLSVDREETGAEIAHRLRIEFITFVLAASFFVTAALLCLAGILVPGVDAELRKTAANGLWVLGGLVGGYLLSKRK